MKKKNKLRYTISSKTPPDMPRLGKGTEGIKLILDQISPDMREPIAPMLFPILSAHICGAEWMYPDNSWQEVCGMMGTLVAESGAGKGQLGRMAQTISRHLIEHDVQEYVRLADWQKEMKTRSANKEKPARPDVALWAPPADMTNAAFIQNAMACERAGGHVQYINMPEIEMADSLCGGHRQVTQMLRNIYDRQRAGALRASAEAVTGNPVLRANLTLSSTPIAARKFFKCDLHNGTFGRMVFSYRPMLSRDGRIPRQGEYDDLFLAQLDTYLERLRSCSGRHVITQLNRLTDRLAEDMARMADLSDDDTLFALSKRAVVSAWRAGCVMWALNGQKWTRAMGDMVEWLVYHDLWSKMQLFADLLEKDADVTTEARKRGPVNFLNQLPDTFNLEKLEALRMKNGKPKEGAYNQAHKWLQLKYVTYSSQTKLYTKTDAYKAGRKESNVSLTKNNKKNDEA